LQSWLSKRFFSFEIGDLCDHPVGVRLPGKKHARFQVFLFHFQFKEGRFSLTDLYPEGEKFEFYIGACSTRNFNDHLFLNSSFHYICQIKLLQWSKQVVSFVITNLERPQQEKILLATESYFSTLFKSYFHSALTRNYCLHPETVLIIIQSPPRSCLKMFLSENCSHYHPTPVFSLSELFIICHEVISALSALHRQHRLLTATRPSNITFHHFPHQLGKKNVVGRSGKGKDGLTLTNTLTHQTTDKNMKRTLLNLSLARNSQ